MLPTGSPAMGGPGFDGEGGGTIAAPSWRRLFADQGLP